jgi:prepilin-type N-terminal cleavage/methylation domain-containing protein
MLGAPVRFPLANRRGRAGITSWQESAKWRRAASAVLEKHPFLEAASGRREIRTTSTTHKDMLQKLNTKRAGFTLVEIMIVVAIIALLAAIAVPNFLRSRKRSQATQVLEDLRIIDGAIDQYAIENNKSNGNSIAWADIQVYIKTGSRLYTSGGNDILGNPYTIPTVENSPKVNVLTYGALSDVAPTTFWSPYY